MKNILGVIGVVFAAIAVAVIVVFFIGWALVLVAVLLVVGLATQFVGVPLRVVKTVGDSKYEIGNVRWFRYRPHAVPKYVGKKD